MQGISIGNAYSSTKAYFTNAQVGAGASERLLLARLLCQAAHAVGLARPPFQLPSCVDASSPPLPSASAPQVFYLRTENAFNTRWTFSRKGKTCAFDEMCGVTDGCTCETATAAGTERSLCDKTGTAAARCTVRPGRCGWRNGHVGGGCAWGGWRRTLERVLRLLSCLLASPPTSSPTQDPVDVAGVPDYPRTASGASPWPANSWFQLRTFDAARIRWGWWVLGPLPACLPAELTGCPGLPATDSCLHLPPLPPAFTAAR